MDEAPLLLPIFSEDNLEHEGALLPQRIMALAAIQVNVITLVRTTYELCFRYKKVYFVHNISCMLKVPHYFEYF